MPINRRMDKEDVVHIHSGILLSHKKEQNSAICREVDRPSKMWYIYSMEYYSAIKRNEIGSFVETWMDLETVTQTEVSQNGKNKYRILTHIRGT